MLPASRFACVVEYCTVQLCVPTALSARSNRSLACASVQAGSRSTRQMEILVCALSTGFSILFPRTWRRSSLPLPHSLSHSLNTAKAQASVGVTKTVIYTLYCRSVQISGGVEYGNEGRVAFPVRSDNNLTTRSRSIQSPTLAQTGDDWYRSGTCAEWRGCWDVMDLLQNSSSSSKPSGTE